MEIPEGAKGIESPGDYPHLFIRVQIKTPEDKPIPISIQQKIKLTGISHELTIDSDEPHSNDPEYRAGALVGHLGFPVHHAYYAPYFTNCEDEVLNGDETEVFRFPYEPEGTFSLYIRCYWGKAAVLDRSWVPPIIEKIK
ncbi:MAG: hypothetical protein K8R59_13675 [Thermoanaerobaculales bacterium]|nr:hypothetical protein [Thermoanaerobaculales bacterium]